MKQQFSKILLIIIIYGFITSCNSVKRVPDGEHLLNKASVIVNDKNEDSDVVKNLIHQRPNSRIPLLGTPLRLFIYNTARPNLDSILKARIENNKKKTARQRRFLSRKQHDKYIQSKLDFNKWIKRTGEAPVVINDSLSKKTLKRLENYYFNNGWFDVEANFTTTRSANKKGDVSYNVTTGEPYIIDSLSTKITTPVVDSLYKTKESKSFIKLNSQYKTVNVVTEKDRITEQMRNSGVYHFSEDNVFFEVDTLGKTKKVKIDVQISDRAIILEDTTLYEPFKIYKVKDVNIFTNSNFDKRNDPITDSTTYNGFNIYSKEALRYNPKTLSDAVFITPNSIFKDKNRPQTSRRISNLNTFKYPKIDYIENKEDTTLTANIYLAPLKKFTLNLGGEVLQSNIQSVGFSFNPGILARNVFKGAETLELRGIVSIGASRDGANERDQFFDINEFGANLDLKIPRFFFPFNTEKIIPKSMFPSTKMSLAMTSQTNVGLDKQTFTGSFNYKWFPNQKVTNRYDLFNIQFVKNLNTANYFREYRNSYNTLNEIAISSGYIGNTENLEIPNQANGFLSDVTTGVFTNSLSSQDIQTVNSINERKVRLTEDNLILASNFNYTKDKRDNLFDNDFSIFRLRLELAGNVFSAAANALGLEKNSDDKYELFNVAFSQYVKTELDYIKYWDLGNKSLLAVRSYFGIAIPYGNSTNIPFSKSFFAGGANDNRAWSVYSLGPGSSTTTNEFNEANLKIALSAENRFNIFGALNGALFIDAGNIWNVLDDVEEDAAIFNSFSSLKDIAIGSGFGLRYDFNFFVIRGDIGFKTYDPSYRDENRWFNDYNFKNAVYNIGINYPF
ncbi:BamA/TamA family outer membrane protein [uncultured Lacinutrix sp.]|uniref:translocation and assembly module lipoprotein TamL n=1 Tax=uncultured Lacinutrix sp. TaxID=574032 RepID=UPI002627D05C|nr:BamA/TamA family outer membrane protein [uncultured Lacinutrix sp.]